MLQVFIVTAGTHEDYRIEGVFSTLESAEKFVEVINPMLYYDNQARVETYLVDRLPEIKLRRWKRLQRSVRM